MIIRSVNRRRLGRTVNDSPSNSSSSTVLLFPTPVTPIKISGESWDNFFQPSGGFGPYPKWFSMIINGCILFTNCNYLARIGAEQMPLVVACGYCSSSADNPANENGKAGRYGILFRRLRRKIYCGWSSMALCARFTMRTIRLRHRNHPFI